MLSIAMATYNGEKYIREQLDSILKQTYQDFELIVCDDCSMDSTWEILKDYKKKDRRIAIHQNDKNIGFKENFQKAILLCQSDYIALSDQDDIWYPNHLEILFENIGEYSLICSNALLVNHKNESLAKTMYDIKNLTGFSQDIKALSFYLFYNNFVQGATALFKKELIDKACPFPESIAFHDHWLALNAVMTKGVVCLNIVTIRYRQHNDTVTQDKISIYKYLLLNVFYRKKQKTYSVLVCLKSRYLSADNWKKIMLDNAIKFYRSKEMSVFPFYAIFFLIKYYKNMYWQFNYKFIFLRILKILLRIV
jgi:glycosyltransferase involved in cell wall biosynthesis